MADYKGSVPIDLARSAPLIQVTEVDNETEINIQAKFPNGPTPLYFGPPIQPKYDREVINWSFSIEGNKRWICGLVPLETKDYLGPYKHRDKPTPFIALENDKRWTVKTPRFMSRVGEIEVVELEGKVEVRADPVRRIVDLICNGETMKTFNLQDPIFDNGYSFCVGACARSILKMVVDTSAGNIKPAKA